MKRIRFVHRTFAVLAVTLAAAVACNAFAAGGIAKGKLTYQSTTGVITMTPKYAYLVKGPDAVDTGRTIRHLILSPTDLGANIEACTTMSCTDSDLASGMTVDLDAGPRLNYWVVLNNQRVQYSGTEPPAALALTANTTTRLAGKLVFNAAAMGGPQVDIEFDAPLLKEMERAR